MGVRINYNAICTDCPKRWQKKDWSHNYLYIGRCGKCEVRYQNMTSAQRNQRASRAGCVSKKGNYLPDGLDTWYGNG